ncbi:MAG: DNRLRE domain-containing protein [Thermoplasmata archaeon]|nr:DNRLRE domain-containing protein [Thermoplasmata archaeon]
MTYSDINQMTVVRLTALAIVLAMCIGAFAPLGALTNAAGPESIIQASNDNAFMGVPNTITQASEPPIVQAAAPVPVEPDTIVLQPNATVGKDAWIANETYELENMGADSDIYIGTGGMTQTDNHKGLFYFEMQTGSRKVSSATLSLYSMYLDTAGKINVTVNPLTSFWTEGTGWQASGEIGYVNGVNCTNGTTWGTPMGDIDYTRESYLAIDNPNLWYSWNVTTIVDAWVTDAIPNYGFILNGTPIDTATNYVGFWSSDYAIDPTLCPKLTITYAAEIDPPVPPQSFQEDDPARDIALNGRANGSVEHVSDVSSIGGLPIPFWGSAHNKVFYHNLYNSTQVGSEGVISRIGFNRSNPTSMTEGVGLFQNLKISIAHTTKTSITTTFNENYQGSLIEVFQATNVYINSSNSDSWIYFDLNKNFTYDSQYNLLVNISWDQDGGTNVRLHTINTGGNICRAYNFDDGTLSASNNGLIAKFLVDVVDNGIFDKGTTNNGFIFPILAGDYTKFQMLYNATTLGNQGGVLDKLRLYKMDTDSGSFYNLTIRVGHTDISDLDMTFASNYVGSLTPVFYQANFTFNPYPYWVEFNLDNIFSYDGVRNLLVEVEWNGTPIATGAIGIARDPNTGTANNCTYTHTPGALTGTTNVWTYSFQAIFTESASLTWSAVSNNPTMFTASATGRTLTITPLANQFGTGTATLTLTNSNGESVSQNIPITINAVNDAPLLAVLANIQCIEDEPRSVNISGSITDIDDPIKNITVTTNSTYAVVNGTNITFLYPEGVSGESILITIKDKGGLLATRIIVANVTQVNDVPLLTGFVSTITCHATLPNQMALNPSDEETPTGQLMIYTNSQYVDVSGSTLHFLYPKGIGSEQVTVYLVDSLTYGTQNNISYTLAVTIIDHPEVVAYSPNGTAVPVTTTVAVTFDMPMNVTKAENAFSMVFGTTIINGTFSWNNGSTIMTFTPADHLTNGVYDIHVAASAETKTGVSMLNAYAWNFTAALGTFDGDGDGMPDQYEIDHGLDPNVDDAAGDLDGDGLTNEQEYALGTDPDKQDSDGDGINDFDEDADNDGYSNGEEYLAGTDPKDPKSVPTSGFPWIIWVLILVAVIVVVVVVLLLVKRKPQPVQEPMYDQPNEGEQFEQAPFEEGNAPPPPEGWTPEQSPEVIPPESLDGQPPQQDIVEP